jgi:hypothetical protein
MSIDLDGLQKVVSDDEIARVHGSANFGSQSPREVVNDGVRKYAIGYQGGHTQLCILQEHGLITKPRPGSYDANLTKKGKKYARALYQMDKQTAAAAARERDGLREVLTDLLDGVSYHEGADQRRSYGLRPWFGEAYQRARQSIAPNAGEPNA